MGVVKLEDTKGPHRHPLSPRGVGASHQHPLGSVGSCLIYADVRLHIPVTHRNERYGIPRKPVVIRCKDGIDKRFGWSTAKWDLDYLAETIGDTHVQVETPANPLDQGTMHGVLPEMLNISFKDYVRELQEPLSEKTRSM